MPLGLEIKRIFAEESERVKSVDRHPTEPWILASLFSGTLHIWNYKTRTMVTSFEDTNLPVRSAKFIARNQWVVAGADDMFIRVYNYDTMDMVTVFKAHTGYIRCVAVHPFCPYVLSSSDDMLIKLWSWEKGWECIRTFEGHSDYVMQVAINPNQANTFASASLDRTIKIWDIRLPMPNFTLNGHLKGVICVDYFTGGDEAYLITGSDDHTAKVWDYQTRRCVGTLEGHTDYVSAVCFHPGLPVIITASVDGTVRIWHSTTYRLENVLNYGFERVWAVGYRKCSRRIVIGYDKRLVMVKLGRDVPVSSMIRSGKVIWAKRNRIQTANIMSLGEPLLVPHGAVTELGNCAFYPQSLKHNPEGKLLALCGDGQYIIYTSRGLRRKSSGSALQVVWSAEGGYAVRESTSKIKIFSKNFMVNKIIQPLHSVEHIYGGNLLAMCSDDCIHFYDWAGRWFVIRMDLKVKNLYWAAGRRNLVAIATDTSCYIYKFKPDVVFARLRSGKSVGLQDAFELHSEVNEQVRSGIWAGPCFFFIDPLWRLLYHQDQGFEVWAMIQLRQPMYLIGYYGSTVYLMDKELNVMGYRIACVEHILICFKNAINRGDLKRAESLQYGFYTGGATDITYNRAARFLELRGMIRNAIQLARDYDYLFELAMEMRDLDNAERFLKLAPSESKWRRLAALAKSDFKYGLSEYCLKQEFALRGSLLVDDAEGVFDIASFAKDNGKNNDTELNYSGVILLGGGGFGYVDKGHFGGKKVTINQFEIGSSLRENEFIEIVETLSHLQHEHLVSLVGLCVSGCRRLLVDEYVPNFTLEFHLHGKGQPLLAWENRVKIALGSAKGLAYLHEACQPKIMHCGISSSNILLDEKFDAKVANFGVARFYFGRNTHGPTPVIGTFGYLAPEYGLTGKPTDKTDVFSFGIVLLELITGRRPTDNSQFYLYDNFVDWARPMLSRALEKYNFEIVADPKLQNDYDGCYMARMVTCASVCISHLARCRPTMSQIVRALEGHLPLGDLTKDTQPDHMVYVSSHGRKDHDACYDTKLTSHEPSGGSTSEVYKTYLDTWSPELGTWPPEFGLYMAYY